MIEFFALNNPSIPITAIPLDDAGTNASKTITVSGTATSAATLTVWVGGRFVRVPVNIGDDADTIAAAIDAAIDADPELIMSAASTLAVVTLTSLNQGDWTDELKVAVSPRLVENGGSDTLPDGVAFVIADTVAGTGNPVLATALDAIPDEIFDYILQPYTDSTNMTALDAELLSRQDGNNQKEGHAFNALVGDLSALTTYGAGRNSPYATTMFGAVDSLSPKHHWASVYAGGATSRAQNDAALPWQFLRLIGLEPGTKTLRFSDANRETLLLNGIATHIVNKQGQILIERGITNFQTNSVGQPSVAFLDSMTPLSLSFARKTIRQDLLAAFFINPFKLVKDGSVIAGSDNIATPKAIKSVVIDTARRLEVAGIFENVDQFASEIEAIISPNVNAVTLKMPPDLVNQLRQILGVIEFIL